MGKKNNQEAIVREIKAWVLEHEGKIPSRDQYEKDSKFSRWMVANRFDGYWGLLRAAGLIDEDGCKIGRIGPQKKGKKKKEPKPDIFYKSIEEQIQEYYKRLDQPRSFTIDKIFEKIAGCSDTHFPFVHPGALSCFYAYLEHFQPEILMVVGDLYDMLAHSSFPGSKNIFNPKEERDLSRSMACDFFATIRKLCPKTHIVLLLGNHDVRPMKKIIKYSPEEELFAMEGFEKMFRFDGVQTVMDQYQEVVIRHVNLGDILVHHGYSTKLGAHRDSELMNCMVGHSHTGGCVGRYARGNNYLFELNCGMLADPISKGMSWTQLKTKKWTLGFSGIDPYGPRFIPV